MFPNFSVLQFLVTTAVLLIGLFLLRRKRNNKLPPGPASFPIVGNALQLGSEPHLTLSKWAKEYGPIYRIKIGMADETVVITDHKLVKSLLSEHASTGRSTNPIILEFSKGSYGITNAEGENWQMMRRFVLRKLRDFGFSKTSMEQMIIDEVRATLEWFRKRQGTPISGNRIFNAPVVNSLWHIVAGERCEWENGTLPDILVASEEISDAFAKISSNGVLFAPTLRFIAPDFLGWSTFVKRMNHFRHIIRNTITSHESTLDPSNPRDFIDHALVEQSEASEENSSFHSETGRKNLIAATVDLFQAGSETSSHTISWSLLYLSHHQDVQHKLRNEINSVVGNSRLPSLSDRSRMVYAEAVIAETLRLSNVVPLGVPHRMLSDSIFQGFHLRKGSGILINAYGILHDPDIWEEPLTFKPERFLSEDETKFVRHEAFIPFSSGKRQCLGESLARDTLFLFITSIFQHFLVIPDPVTKGKPDFQPEKGFFHFPKPFKVVMTVV